MRVFIVTITDYYGYPISRTRILGVFSTIQLAEQALIKDGAVCDDGRWVYPDDSRDDPSTADIIRFYLDAV